MVPPELDNGCHYCLSNIGGQNHFNFLSFLLNSIAPTAKLKTEEIMIGIPQGAIYIPTYAVVQDLCASY